MTVMGSRPLAGIGRRARDTGRWLVRMDGMPLYDWFDLVYIYAIAGTCGTVWEIALTLVTKGVYEDRSGSILTPFNYVYGLGALAVFLTLRSIRRPLMLYLAGCLLGGGCEFSMSLIQEYLLGSRSWDYSHRLLNIAGRTTVPYMMVWGAMCFLLVRFVFPIMIRLAHRLSDATRKRLVMALLALVLIDAAVTLPAILRYAQRADGIFFGNWYLRFIDAHFGDTFMRLHFPNMRV